MSRRDMNFSVKSRGLDDTKEILKVEKFLITIFKRMKETYFCIEFNISEWI